MQRPGIGQIVEVSAKPSRSHVALTVGSLLAAAGLLTGCGAHAGSQSASKRAYERAMVRADRQTEDAIGALGAPPRGLPKAAEYLRSTAQIYDREARRFRAIVPPPEVAADHRALIAEDVATARQYRRLADYIEHPRKAQRPSVRAAVETLPRSFRVLSDYRAKGYDLGPITGS